MYRTICTELWTDPDIDGLGRDGKLLFVYLITNPHTHLSGIYYLPKTTMALETKISDRVVDTLLHTLSELEKAFFDTLTRTVFVTKMFSYQGRGEKNDRAAAKQLETLHKSPLIKHFLTEYPQVEAYWTGAPIDTLSDTPSDSGKRCPPVSDSDSSSVSVPLEGKESEKGEFEQFWNCYPLKVGKIAARKAFERINNRPPIDVILTAIHRAVISPKWTKDDGDYIPHPTTWLNQGRWDDQPPVKPMTTSEAFLTRKDAQHEPTRLPARLVPSHDATVGQGVSDNSPHHRGT